MSKKEITAGLKKLGIVYKALLRRYALNHKMSVEDAFIFLFSKGIKHL
jgi:hypothetical protein